MELHAPTNRLLASTIYLSEFSRSVLVSLDAGGLCRPHGVRCAPFGVGSGIGSLSNQDDDGNKNITYLHI